ncbi:single-stranded DNA-binding protein [Catenisphaera adipataccumulans]|uniref:Single-stranded DNA-binding protein n=1 Tax=Catenisphaera adipataccumulans TaxID=700500 RepID=A0A7W8D1D0_9FIRM|nr:single-stranded DNA-binding protein [Catenisphaera adipataccumulans]MBB5183755.1 single-strand DNA-binding protein [Catenisphaera adipataccumulans]
MNVFCVVGKIQALPELKETPSGLKTTSVLLKVQRAYPNSEGIYESDFFNIEVWRGLAETLCDTCTVDTVLAVKGRLASRIYQKEDRTFYNYVMVAEKIDFVHIPKAA